MKHKIIEYFSKYKLSPTGIGNFIRNKPEIRLWIEDELKNHPEYNSVGGYIICLVKQIELPKCRYCDNKVNYHIYKQNRPYCSLECFKNDFLNVKNNREKTNLKKYGVKNCGELKEIQEKRRLTNLDRYGVENITQNPEYVKKAKKTMIEKFGVDSYLKTEDSKRKHYLKSYQTILSWNEYVEPLFTFEEYHGWKHNEIYKWRCVKCGNEFISDLHIAFSNRQFISRMPRCLNCFPFIKNKSYAEKEIVEFIKTIYDGEIIENDRELIKPYEIDIVIPEYKLAIEYNGLFWHNEHSGKDKNYHLNKTEWCESKKYQLLHIFEDEWRDNQDDIKDLIKSKLGIFDKKIYARQCYIKEEIHENTINIKLYHNDKIVYMMSIEKEDDEYEIINYASSLNIQVIGGFSKLLKYFEKIYKPKTIKFIYDRKHGNGELFYKLGFKEEKLIKPDCWLVKNKKKYFKNQIKDAEFKIYDCGKKVFIKHLHF